MEYHGRVKQSEDHVMDHNGGRERGLCLRLSRSIAPAADFITHTSDCELLFMARQLGGFHWTVSILMYKLSPLSPENLIFDATSSHC
jgi:hypothetical protein